MRILIVEDELHLGEALAQILKKHCYSVDTVSDGESGLDNALSNIYDLMILDIMLPKTDGISVLKSIRKEGIDLPIILLSAKGEISDKVTGLDSGADDYLAKPFAIEELLARVRALSRRKNEILPNGALKYKDIELNTTNLKLSKGCREVRLTLKESKLLEFLILRKNVSTSKERTIEKIWGYDSEVEHNHVEVYISFLRKKLSFLDSEVIIHTVRGVGLFWGIKTKCLKSLEINFCC